MPIALADLIPLLVFGVALALTIMCIALTKAFFGVSGAILGKLPVVGGWIDATGHHIERRITDVLGDVALKLEAGIGATWHFSARLVDWMGREINRHASLLATIAQLLPGVNLIGSLYATLATVAGRVTRLVHRLEGIGHDLAGRIGHVERGIGRDVLPRVKALEREIDHVVLRDVASLRARSRALERDYARLYKWMRTHPWTVVTDAFVGAVAIALGRLGLSWLRCASLGRLGKSIGCGGFGILEELLFGAFTVLAVTDLCEFAALAYAAAEELAPLLMDLVDVENALVGCHGATRPPPLGLRALSLPPVRDPLPLAA